MKHCKKCGETKPLTEFYVKNEWKLKPARSHSCIPCAKAYARAYSKKRYARMMAMGAPQ